MHLCLLWLAVSLRGCVRTLETRPRPRPSSSAMCTVIQSTSQCHLSYRSLPAIVILIRHLLCVTLSVSTGMARPDAVTENAIHSCYRLGLTFVWQRGSWIKIVPPEEVNSSRIPCAIVNRVGLEEPRYAWHSYEIELVQIDKDHNGRFFDPCASRDYASFLRFSASQDNVLSNR